MVFGLFGQFDPLDDVGLVKKLDIFMGIGIPDIHMGVVIEIDIPVAHRRHVDLPFEGRPVAAHHQRDHRRLVGRQGRGQHQFQLGRILSRNREPIALLSPLGHHIDFQFTVQFRAFELEFHDTAGRTVRAISVHRTHHTIDRRGPHIRIHGRRKDRCEQQSTYFSSDHIWVSVIGLKFIYYRLSTTHSVVP